MTTIEELKDYCHFEKTVKNADGYEIVHNYCYRVDKSVNTDSCADCPKCGCDTHTVAQDLEMVINREKTLDEI